MSAPPPLRLGTRGSLLARTQSGWVADQLRTAHPGLLVELVPITTSGDRLTDRPLADAGGKGLFTKELEMALLEGKIDFAVHSLKDVPVTMPLVDQADLTLAAVPPREDPRDVLVSRSAQTLADLLPGQTVGTGSLRRRCQILHARPDLLIQPLRGNIDTRLRKAESGEHNAIILALAGLKRIGRFDPAWMHPMDQSQMLPAAGQGALVLQCRRDDSQTISILAGLNDADTFAAVTAERAVVSALGGDCHSPIAALATLENGVLTLQTAVGRRGGDAPVLYARASAPLNQWQNAVTEVCRSLQKNGPII